MNRAFAGDFHQFVVLFCAQRARDLDLNVDPVQHALLRFAFLAILCVNTRVPQRNCNAFDRKLLPARVQADCHRSTYSERGQEIIVRIGAAIAAACAHWFVSDNAVLARDDLLSEVARAAAHNDVRRCVALLCTHVENQGRRIPAKRSRYDQTRKSSSTKATIAIGTRP